MEAETLGKYQLLKRLAAGGMAEIFLARVSGVRGFEKVVCIKRILPQLAGNQDFVQMFLDEARIAATLHHPNIVQMYDIGEADDSYFIAMEYLHGEDVRTLIKGMRASQRWIPLEHALHIIIGLCAGLHYAHEKVGFDGEPLGIVHRDVNPQNVFVTYHGAVKIVDFGIAKATNRLSETRAGTLKGKIPYMSPEQCKSEALDRRSDIFAIGIMLYELTTAYRLYKGHSEFEVLKKIVEGTVTPPSQIRPDYPASLEAIVMKALAKHRDQRYQTALAMQADLEQFAREHKLPISSIALTAYMQDLFPGKVEAWRDALAKGRDLGEHLAAAATPKPASQQDEEEDDDAPPFETVTVAGPAARKRAQSEPSIQSRPRERPVGEAAIETGRTDRLSGSRRGRKLALAAAAALLLGGGGWLALRGGGFDGEGAGASARGASAYASAQPASAADAAPAAWAAAPVDAGTPDATQVAAVGPANAGASKPRPKPKPKPKPPEPAGPPGELRLASSPSCEVIVNGKSRGSTPIAGLMLPPGKHKVQLINSRFGIDKTYAVEVKSGEVTKKKYDFPTKP